MWNKNLIAREDFIKLAANGGLPVFPLAPDICTHQQKNFWRNGGLFLVSDNLLELIAVSEGEILSQVGKVIQVVVVGNEFFCGVASLYQKF